jgi:hypothetical protein
LVSSVKARLVRTMIGPASREAHALVLFRYDAARVVISIDEASHPVEAARVEAELARGFLAEIAPSGSITALRIDPGATPLARSFARTLAGSMQVTLPSATLSSWNAREVDTQGPHASRYVVVNVAHGARAASERLALKRTSGPLDAHAERGDPLAALLRGESVTSGVAEIDFDLAAGELLEIASDETSDSSLGGRKVAHASSAFEAERISMRTLTSAELEALARDTAGLRDAPPTALDARGQELAREEASRHWLAGASLADIARGLDDEARRPKDGRAFDLFLKVQAYAYLHPSECAAIARLLASRPPRGISAETIVAGLASNGSPNAQAALVDVVTTRAARVDAQLTIIPALGMLSHPLPSTEDAVRVLRDSSPRADVRDTAALALGIMARSLASTSPERATRIVDESLANLARDGSSERAQIFELTVLGNTGAPRIVSDVVRLSHAESPALRAQAAFALRFVPNAAAEARLLELLTSDDDVHVRSRAASALSYRERTDESARVQRARAVDEPDAGVRADLLHTLFAMRSADPESFAVVSDRRDHDPDQSVRNVAAAFLAKAGIE